MSNVSNVANVASSGGDFDGAAFWRRLAAAAGGAGVIELGAGETGLVGLMAAKLLQCHCSSGPKGSEWHVATCLEPSNIFQHPTFSRNLQSLL